jgi:hypothetical protein
MSRKWSITLLVASLMLLTSLSMVIVLDALVLPRIGEPTCLIFGRAADSLGVADGARVDPDSGGCRAYGCVDIVTSTNRILLPDIHRTESVRLTC